ncbi:alpha/beta fold hydrolase [Vibrio sp. SS-MA-C1-2]|uniref:alpha/beta fold hydrolase n=1 Tax=Vibrio sp. SS-MA-C1-2 TaxID=2908646 RepID=UPI001F334938|nr:alpha/beta fold hydrolase [Vibrio sp. SS-MA-C1-2]UJF17296.1 alpha/beta fold hydrolase [Vibrio sp. SS-MA-C1-2]
MGKHFAIDRHSFDLLELFEQDVDKIALVVEGGGQRTIFSAGVLDTFLKANFNPFSLLIGVSAGSLNIASYLTGELGHAYDVITKVTRHPEFFDFNKYIMRKQGMNLNFLIDQTENTYPLQWDQAREHLKNKTFLAAASHAHSLETRFFNLNNISWQDALKASSSIPFVSTEPTIIEDQPWVDGGVSAAIPVEEAYKQGYKHIVVIRSIPADETHNHEWVRFLTKVNKLGKSIPMMAEMLLKHEENYRQSQAFLNNPPDDLNIYEIHPRTKLASSVLGSSKRELHEDYKLGKRMGQLFLATVAKKLHLKQDSQVTKTFPLITHEHNLIDNIRDHINFLWSSATKGSFKGVDNIEIKWINVNPRNNKNTIVIVNGRNETFWKYQEIILELSEHYNVYAYDHRGQGESERFTNDPELGHVDDFSDYVVDLYMFMEKVVNPTIEGKCFILAHSMGGVVATKYLALFENNITAAALSSPMFGVAMPKAMKLVRKQAMGLMEYFSRTPNYALGTHQYKNEPFDGNVLTQSKVRYKLFREIYNKNEHLRLGGPTIRWINESIRAGEKCIKNAHKIKTPILILQAEQDTVVDNRAQDRFNERCSTSRIFEVKEAFHDILIDKDQCRHQAIVKLLQFFNKEKFKH